MAIPILNNWEKYFQNYDEGLGSTYERFIINEILNKAVKNFQINSVLESPSFGFTGLSGINSLGLALQKIEVTINDNNRYRLAKISRIWEPFQANVHIDYVENFNHLPYSNQRFDLAWNFSSLWFVDNFEKYLEELSRVSKKLIIIMVPNTTGIGYLHQKYTHPEQINFLLKEPYIKPKYFIHKLQSLGWNLLSATYIDCPLWPDIGMAKESFIKQHHLGWFFKHLWRLKKKKSIINYYSGKDIFLKEQVLKYNFLEAKAPLLIKKIWAHHRCFIFTHTTR